MLEAVRQVVGEASRGCSLRDQVKEGTAREVKRSKSEDGK